MRERKTEIYRVGERQLKICDLGKREICQLAWCLHTFLFSNSPLSDYNVIFMGSHSSLSPFFFHHPTPALSLSLCLLIVAGSFTRLCEVKRKTTVLTIKAKIFVFFVCLYHHLHQLLLLFSGDLSLAANPNTDHRPGLHNFILTLKDFDDFSFINEYKKMIEKSS